MVTKEGLDYLFSPKSVAIVGISTKGSAVSERIGGGRFLDCLQSSGFKGNIYLVNPKGGEISGSKVYANITDIPWC